MTTLMHDPRLAALIDQARDNDWAVTDEDDSVVFESADRLIVRQKGDELVMFGSVSYPGEPLYMSDDYPFDLDLAMRFLRGERWAL